MQDKVSSRVPSLSAASIAPRSTRGPASAPASWEPALTAPPVQSAYARTQHDMGRNLGNHAMNAVRSNVRFAPRPAWAADLSDTQAALPPATVGTSITDPQNDMQHPDNPAGLTQDRMPNLRRSSRSASVATNAGQDTSSQVLPSAPAVHQYHPFRPPSIQRADLLVSQVRAAQSSQTSSRIPAMYQPPPASQAAMTEAMQARSAALLTQRQASFGTGQTLATVDRTQMLPAWMPNLGATSENGRPLGRQQQQQQQAALPENFGDQIRQLLQIAPAASRS